MVEITLEQRANLRLLADFLRTNASTIDFSMRVFARDRVTYLQLDPQQIDADHPCGSTCCAIGFGPAAGIPVIPEDGDDWPAYATRVFGVLPGNDDDDSVLGKLWWGIFASEWASINNTAEAAASRITQFLDTGELVNPADVYRPLDY